MESSPYHDNAENSSGPEGRVDKKDKKKPRLLTRADVAAQGATMDRLDQRFGMHTRREAERQAVGQAMHPLEGVVFMRRPETGQPAPAAEAEQPKPAAETATSALPAAEWTSAPKQPEQPAPPAAETPKQQAAGEAENDFSRVLREAGLGSNQYMEEPRVNERFVPPAPSAEATPAEWTRPPMPHQPPAANRPPAMPAHEQPQRPLTSAEHRTFEDLAAAAELPSAPIMPAAETFASMPAPRAEYTPAPSAAHNADQQFRDIIQHNYQTDPGEGRVFERPGQTPFDINLPPRPPQPPTAEGGAFGDGFEPERPSANEAVPAALLPAGNILRGGAAGLTAAEATRRLESLRHRAVESSLAGAVTILGVGLVAEHILAKRRDRKLKKQIVSQHKDIRATAKDLQREQAAHAQTRNQLNKVAAESAATAQAQYRYNQQRPHYMRRAESMAVPPVGEHMVTPPTNPEAPAPAAPEELAEMAGPQLEPGQHLESSAWHNMVVDEKGRVVENAIAYGRGFQQEQQQENIRDPLLDKQTDVSTSMAATAAPGVIPAAPAGGLFNIPTEPALPPPAAEPALPPGLPTHKDPQHLLPQNTPHTNQVASTLHNPWVWLFMALLLAAFFGASLLG